MSEIFNELQDIISTHLGIPKEEITRDAHFSVDLNAGPLSIAEIITSIEAHFKVSLPREELVRISTLGDLNEVVSEKLNEEGLGA